MMSLSRDVDRITITFADGEIKTFTARGHYITRLNEAQSKSANAHGKEEDEQSGKWLEHELWWRSERV
jgi:hypothetical protein